MIICIVEDEPVIAQRIERLLTVILENKITRIKHFSDLESAKSYIISNPINLMFLDLNLKGKDGFDIFKELETHSFHTIIISAYSEKAIDAFQFPVADFIEKPFDKERLEKALSKIKLLEKSSNVSSRFISIKREGEIKLLDIEEIMYIKGASVYSEIFLKNDKTELHHSNLEKIDILLPENFIRVHKSYIINIFFVEKFKSYGGSKYSVILKNSTELPVSRMKYKEIKSILSVD